MLIAQSLQSSQESSSEEVIFPPGDLYSDEPQWESLFTLTTDYPFAQVS